MTRELIKSQFVGFSKGFRFRGENQTRLETFSDAVFALAVTLLLISSRPPTTFNELKEFASELLPFAMCIALIGIIWFQHFMFFLRFGLTNAYVVFLNLILLFTVLFYVYPLKFLTQLNAEFIYALFGGMTAHRSQRIEQMIGASDVGLLMIIYGLGAVSIFAVLALMYRYAASKKNELDLNQLEYFDTRTGYYTNVLMASVPLLSVVVAAIFYTHPMTGFFAGMVYMLYWPLMFIYGFRRGKLRNKLSQN